jgi:hypothetical protein
MAKIIKMPNSDGSFSAGSKRIIFSAQRLIGQMVKIISTTRTTATANGAQWSRMLLQNS